MIEGNSMYHKKRIIEMETEIDEQLLNLDKSQEKRTLHKNVIKQFKEYYPDDLTAVKELQLDYSIFMNAWQPLSEKGKGIRIKSDDKTFVSFFKKMSEDQQFEQKMSDNEKSLKL